MAASTNTIAWQFKAPAGMSWEIHKFSLLDAILAARNLLPWHEDQQEFDLHCGQVAFAVLRQLPQFLKGPGDGGPVAWLQLSIEGPCGRAGLIEEEIVPDSKELSGLTMTHAGKTVRVVLVGVPQEFVELTIQQGFRV